MCRLLPTTAYLATGLTFFLAAAPAAHAARLVFNETGAASLLQDDTHLVRMRQGVFLDSRPVVFRPCDSMGTSCRPHCCF